MAIRKQIPDKEGIYFITFTCYQWMPLIQIVNGYDIIYKQFDYLQTHKHYILGYVIMPNHVHALLAFNHSNKSINTIIGNMKRFIAYEMIKQLKEKNQQHILKILSQAVQPADKKKGKLHEVFEPSFDCKHCKTVEFIQQKLNYMHNNPCTGKWNLVGNAIDYIHSSAKFYSMGEQGIYTITNYMQLEDVDLTITK